MQGRSPPPSLQPLFHVRSLSLLFHLLLLRWRRRPPPDGAQRRGYNAWQRTTL